jgi:hypothetical protein
MQLSFAKAAITIVLVFCSAFAHAATGGSTGKAVDVVLSPAATGGSTGKAVDIRIGPIGYLIGLIGLGG